MKKLFIGIMVMLVMNIALNASSSYVERESSAYKVVSTKSTITILCSNGEKVYIKKDNHSYYTSSKRFSSLNKASKSACKLDSKENAILKKGALVCRNNKSLIYLLKSRRNYEKVIKGLSSSNIYKNCYFSTKRGKVLVSAHYNDKNLIKDYYVIDLNKNQKRYVPIEFIESLNATQKHTNRYHKDRKKQYRKKSNKVKKYTKRKKIHTIRKKHIKKKKHTIRKKHIHRKKHTIRRVKKSSVSKTIHNNILPSSESKVNISTASNDSLDYFKVYRCTVVSSDKSFYGEYIDKEKSKKMALDNCNRYKKSESICLPEDCYIVRIDLH